jgi:general secretion pathway protein N
MKRRSLVAIGLAIYTLGVISFAPASLVDAGLQRISQGRLHLVEVQGTLWSGSGQIELRDAQGRAGVAKHLAWRLRPESLLRGQLVGDIQLDREGSGFPVAVSISGIEIANADIRLPAAALGLAMPRLAVLGLGGELEVHIPGVSIESGQLRGRLALRLRQARSAFTPIFPLGDYELNLDGQGARVQLFLHTLQGPLQLDGKGSWVIGRNPEFVAAAHVPPQHMRQLDPLLRLIAVERGTGRFELQL